MSEKQKNHRSLWLGLWCLVLVLVILINCWVTSYAISWDSVLTGYFGIIEDKQPETDASQEKPQRFADLDALREAERAAELERRQAERIQEAERRRDRVAAEARTVIEFWEPRRRDLIRRIDAEQDARRRSKLETQLFQAEQRLQKAYWTIEN